MVSTRWLLVTTWLAGLPGLAAVDLEGPFRMGRASLRITTEGHRVHGFPGEPGACGFDANRPVLDGVWEGNVLVGRIVLCEEGEGCGERTYPFLGFFSAADGTLTADIDLATACSTPALVDGRLVLQPSLPRNGGSASALVSANARRGRHLEAAQRLLERNNLKGASRELQLALEQHEDPALVHLGLATVDARQGRWKQAVAHYQRSLDARPAATTFYKLAGAWARLRERRHSLDALRKAVASGFDDAQALERDADLSQYIRNDPEFQSVLAQVRRRAETAP